MSNEIDLTLPKAIEARQHLTTTRTQQGTQKPPLLRISGDLLVPIYNLKNQIEVAFKADFNRIDDLQQELQEIRQKAANKAENKPRATVKEMLSHKDYKRFNDIQKMLSDSEISKDKYTKKINIAEKINIHDLKECEGVDVDEVSAIDFAIDFTDKPKTKNTEA